MNWLKNIGSFLASPLRGIAKKAGTWIIENETNWVRDRIKAALEKDGPPAIDKLFDGLQARIEERVKALPLLSDAVKARINLVVEDEGNKLQAQLRAAAVQGGEHAINAAFEAFKAAALARVQAL
jgi:hypothetical protein